MQLKTKKKKAFTLVELVIVIAVIGILSAVLVPTFGDVVQRAYLVQDKALVGNINTALAVDQITTGSPNDAVDIQTRLIEDYGLTLETKSEGNYIWYNTATKQVELKKLSEFEGTSTKAAADALVANADGEYALMDAIEAPEIFISNGKDNYLFLSTESKDDFADAIRAMRNGTFKVDDKDALDVIKEIDANVGEKFEAFFATTAVMTNNGVVANGGIELANCTRIIVAADVETVTATTLKNVNSTSAIIVDFHYGVESFGEGGEDALNESSGVIYTYVNENLYTSATNENVKKNLVKQADRKEYIGTVKFIHLVDGEEFAAGAGLTNNVVKNEEGYTIAALSYLYYGLDSTKAYNFLKYSLVKDGKTLCLEEGKAYEVKGDAQYLIQKDSEGNIFINVYCLWEEDVVSYHFSDKGYYSNEVVNECGMISSAESGTTITVIGTNAQITEDATIPAGVTLHVPYGSEDTTGKLSFISAQSTPNPTSFAKLTVNSTVTVKGKILVGGQLQRNTQGDAATNCLNVNTNGEIVLNDGSELVVDGGNLEVYGFVNKGGDVGGKITVNAGGKVTEAMNIGWPGGNMAVRLSAAGVSPFTLWELNNIKTPIKVCNGANYFGYTFADPLDNEVELTVAMVAPSSYTEKHMFEFASADAYLEKSITDDGKLNLDLHGTFVDHEFAVEQSSYTIDYQKVGFPLYNCNINIYGTTTLSKNLYKLLGGSVCNVYGTFNIQTEVYMHDYLIKYKTDNTTRLTSKKASEFNVHGTVNLTGATFCGKLYAKTADAKVNVSDSTTTNVESVEYFYNGGHIAQTSICEMSNACRQHTGKEKDLLGQVCTGSDAYETIDKTSYTATGSEGAYYFA